MSAIVGALDTQIQRLASLADNAAIPYNHVILWFSALQTYFEYYVIRRQLLTTGRKNPPPELKAHLTQKTFDKAQAYSRDKLMYSSFKTVYNWCVQYAFIRLEVHKWAWDLTASWMEALGWAQSYVIVHSLAWMTLLVSLTLIPDLCWSYYHTFVLEAKHGFNKTTVNTWVTDHIKSYVLSMALGYPFLGGFLRIIDWAGKNFIPWLMLFIIVVQVIAIAVFPTLIQPLFNKLTPLPDGEVRTRVENLASKLKFPLKHLYVIDGSKRSSHSNAYFYGLPWSKHIVIYDTLIEKSTPAEIEAVLAHELGHWSYAHPSQLLLLSEGNLLFSLTLFSVFIHNKALFGSFGFDPQLAVSSPYGGPQPIAIGFMLYQLLSEPLDTFVKFGVNALTRKFEYQADEFAVNLGYKNELASGLIKLHIDNLSSPHADKLFSMYNHSHPTLPERLRAMDEYKGGDGLKKKNGTVEVKKDL